MRRSIVGVVVAVIAAGCGTGSTDVVFDEPTPTLFDDETVETIESTTTQAVAVGVDALSTAEIPEPRRGATGVVMLDGVAAPVVGAGADGWTIDTPCGSSRKGSEPEPQTALVVLDPAGDVEQAPGDVERNAVLASLVAAQLDEVGVSTLVTRDGEADVAASYRRDAAEATGALVVVSLLFTDSDASLGPTADPSLEVVHPAADADGRRLAGLVYAELWPVLDLMSVGWPGPHEAGVRAVLNQRGDDFFSVLRERSGAARVVVHLPLDPDAAFVFSDVGVAPRLGEAIADAIARYLLTSDEGDGFVAPPEVVREAPTTSTAEPCVDPLAVEPAE